MKVFQRILELRKERGMTQRELARRLGLTPSAVAMYERGEREPSLDTLGKCAEIFGVDFNTLLCYSDMDKTHQALNDEKTIGQIVRQLRGERSFFSQRLKVALENKNMKQAQLAALLGVDRSYVTNWVSGKYCANEETKKKISSILGVSMAWLSGYDASPEPAELVEVTPRDRLDEMLLSMFNKLSPAHQEDVIRYINKLTIEEN